MKSLPDRPAKVVFATRMLYLVIAFGVIQTIMTVFRHIDVRSPFSLIFTKLAIYSISFFLIYQLSNRKNWARWSLVVILVISLPLTILPTFDALSHSPMQFLLGLVKLVIYIVALVVLFQESSSRWYRSE